MCSHIHAVIYYLEDLEMFALAEGRASFLESYFNNLLGYQLDEI